MTEFLTPIETAHRLRCSPKLLSKMRQNGTGPKFTHVGHLVRYELPELNAWLVGRTYADTTQYVERSAVS